MASKKGAVDNINSAQTVLSASVKGTTFLILVQVISRALTFTVNQLLLRFLSPQLLGVSVQLELYSVSVLYFARESVRVATQRRTGDAGTQDETEESHGPGKAPQTMSEAMKMQGLVNIAYVPILLGVPLAWGFGSLYLSSADDQVLSTPHFEDSLKVFGLAALLELCTEPCFLILQQKMLYKTRAVTETAATIVKCFIIFGFTFYAYRSGRDWGVLPFALGQMGFATVVFLSYFWNVGRIATMDGFSLQAKPVSSSDPTHYLLHRFSKPLLTLSLNMYSQGFVKHILTYGDTFILGLFSTLSDQGLYGLASNYGGLIARMVFQPIEESSRSVFGKLLATTDGTTKPKPDSVKTALAYLYDVLRLYSLLSVLACSLGPTIFPQVFRILIGSRWASTNIDGVLSTYCYYIPVLAFNGISEAFVSSVASNSVLRSQSLMMTVFTLGFGGAAFIFLRVLHWGAEGLVWANIANMVLRTGWSAGFLLRYFRGMEEEFDFKRILPTAGTFATAAGATAVLRALNPAAEGGFRGLVKSGCIALCTGCLILFFERRHLMQYYHKFLGRYPTHSRSS